MITFPNLIYLGFIIYLEAGRPTSVPSVRHPFRLTASMHA